MSLYMISCSKVEFIAAEFEYGGFYFVRHRVSKMMNSAAYGNHCRVLGSLTTFSKTCM